jgi:hypothetical protein
MCISDRCVCIAIISLGLAGGCMRLWGEEGKIARRLDELAKAASADGEENPVVQMAAGARVARYFSENAVIDRGEGTAPLGRESIATIAAQARAAMPRLKVRFEDVTITLDSSTSAGAHTTLVIAGGSAPAPDGDVAGFKPGPAREAGLDARELKVTLEKVDGEWVIARVDALETLERPK